MKSHLSTFQFFLITLSLPFVAIGFLFFAIEFGFTCGRELCKQIFEYEYEKEPADAKS